MLTRSYELCRKTYGEKHMLMLRLYLNIGILYEDNRDFNKAYDYFVKWNDCCMEVMCGFLAVSVLVKAYVCRTIVVRIL